MADNKLNIVMTLTDQLSTGLAKAGQSVMDFNRSCQALGRQLQMVGRNMAFLGGSIIAPFTASLIVAEKSSFAVSAQMNELRQNLAAFNTALAESAVPSVNKFNDALSVTIRAYQDLDPQLRESMTSWTLTTGAILGAAGAVTIFAAALVKLLPILIAVSAAYVAYQAAQTKTGSAFATGGFFGIGAALGKDPKQVSVDLQTYIDKLQDLKNKFNEGMDVAGGFAKIMEDVKKALTGQGGALDKAKTAWNDFKTVAVAATKQIGAALTQNLGDTIFNALTNKVHSLKEVFISFGNDVLRILSHAFAKVLLMRTVGAAFPSMLGSFHSGGIIKAHDGLAPDEIPIIAQTGEGVLSRRGMSKLGSSNLRKLNAGGDMDSGGVTVVINQVIQAWDAQDVYRNRKVISGAIAEEIKSNGKMRETIKKYA